LASSPPHDAQVSDARTSSPPPFRGEAEAGERSTTRVQLEMPPQAMERLQKLKDRIEAASYAEVIRNALRLSRRWWTSTKKARILVEARRWRDRAVQDLRLMRRVDMPSPNHDSRGHDERGGAPVDMLLLHYTG